MNPAHGMCPARKGVMRTEIVVAGAAGSDPGSEPRVFRAGASTTGMRAEPGRREPPVRGLLARRSWPARCCWPHTTWRFAGCRRELLAGLGDVAITATKTGPSPGTAASCAAFTTPDAVYAEGGDTAAVPGVHGRAAGRAEFIREHAVSTIEHPARVYATPKTERKGNILASWLSSTDHKIIGHLYLITSFFFFLCAGLMAHDHAGPAARPGPALRVRPAVQRAVHHARHDHAAAVRHPAVRRVRERDACRCRSARPTWRSRGSTC